VDGLRRFVMEIGRLFNRPEAETLGGGPKVAPTTREVEERLTPFPIQFLGGTTGQAVRVPLTANPAAVLAALGISHPSPAIAIMGGAGQMDAAALAAVRSTIEDGIVQFAAHHDLVVVDGGTASGTMALVGMARQRRGYTFPLIGVAPEGKVAYPGFANPAKEADLDPHHSQFVLVETDHWGGESALLAGIAAAAGREAGRRQPVLGIVINGGSIVAQEAYDRATGLLRFPLLVMDGSGRFADELAAAYRTGQTDQAKLRAILDQGEIYVQSITGDPAGLRHWLGSFFGL